MIEIWILLIAAHCFGDFLFQPNTIARNKHRMGYLGLHAGIHGVLVYLILQQWAWWPLIPAVVLTHGLIDFVKARCGQGSRSFATDQFAHVVVLGLIAGVAVRVWPEVELMGSVALRDPIVMAAGLIAAVWGAGFFIGALAKEMCVDNRNLEEALGKGLKNGGAMIGKLERALIFVFIAIGQPAGIGFLIAAKSVLRFEEAKKQPLAEYVLIGTLWSFGLALTIASFTFYLVN